MNQTQQSVRVGLFFLLGLALAWITFESLNGGQLFRPKGYTLVAPFPNLKGLKAGDEVVLAGVKIGTVAATRLGAGRVEAVLTIEPGVQLPDDTVATIEASSLLGNQRLAVSFGTSPRFLAPGAELATRTTTDLNEVIAQLGSLGAKLETVAGDISTALGGGADGGESLFKKIGRLVDDNGPPLTETLANLRAVTAKLNSAQGTLGKLVNEPTLHDELLASVAEIKRAAADAQTFLADTRGVIADVKAGKGTLGALLYDQPTADNLKFTMNNLRELSAKLNSGQGTLGKLINDDTVYRDIQVVVKKADRALDGFGEQGPITAVGVIASSLF